MSLLTAVIPAILAYVVWHDYHEPRERRLQIYEQYCQYIPIIRANLHSDIHYKAWLELTKVINLIPYRFVSADVTTAYREFLTVLNVPTSDPNRQYLFAERLRQAMAKELNMDFIMGEYFIPNALQLKTPSTQDNCCEKVLSKLDEILSAAKTKV